MSLLVCVGFNTKILSRQGESGKEATPHTVTSHLSNPDAGKGQVSEAGPKSSLENTQAEFNMEC